MYRTKLWHLLHLYGTKIAFFCLFLLLLPTTGWSQKNLPNHDKKLLHFGISLGLNNSNFGITRSDLFSFHDTIQVVDSPRAPGFNIGIISDLHLGPHADLRFIPALIFAEKKLRYEEFYRSQDTTQVIESIILSFPLSFKYKSDRFFDNFRFYVLGGLRFDWDLASNSKARKATDIVKIASNDFRIDYGFGLEFYFPLFIFSPEIKISQGIRNLHVPTPDLRYSDVLDKLRSRYITISLQFEG